MLGPKSSNKYGNVDEGLFRKFEKNSQFKGYLEEITINLQGECEEKPYPDMVEECKPQCQMKNQFFLPLCNRSLLIHMKISHYKFTDKLTIENTKANLDGSIWGILRGLESFSQLIFKSSDHSMVR